MRIVVAMNEGPGHAIHYAALEPGTPIYGSDGEKVGEIVKVLDNYREHILDGIVFRDADGAKRFVDGPEVQRTYEHAVALNITSSQAARLGPPPKHATGIVGRLFGGS